MRIDRKLNLVIPVEREDEGPAYVHAVPLRPEVFQRYALVIAKTFSAIYQQGLNFIAGPRVAAILLRQIAEELGVWEGPEGVENGLMAEIRRTSNIIAPTAEGWQPVPLQDALRQELLSEEELSEVEGLITFFTVASSMHRGAEKRITLEGMCRIWEAQLLSSSCTEFAASLPTLTPVASTGAKVKVSSTRP